MKKFCVFLVAIFLYFPSSSQWNNLNTNISGNLFAVRFISAQEGLVAGESGIYLTNNGGSSWSKQLVTTNLADSIILERSVLRGIQYNSGYWYVVGKDTVTNKGVIFSSSSSTPWHLAHSVTGKGLNSVTQKGNYVIAVGEAGVITYNSNNGSTWNSHSSGVTVDLHYVHSNGQKMYLAADSLLLYNHYFPTTPWSITPTYPNRTFKQIHTANNDKAYCVNSNNIISGSTSYAWGENKKYTAPLNATSIYLASNSLAYIGTENGILRSMGNLSNVAFYFWEKSSSTTNYHINDLFFVNGSTYLGYAVGKNGLVLKTVNAGGDHLPQMSFNGPDGGCVGSTLNFTNTSANTSSYTHSWAVNDSIISNSYHSSFTFNDTGTYTVTLITNNYLFTDSLHKIIRVVSIPDTSKTISISDSVLCKSGQTNITLYSSDVGIDYSLRNTSDQSVVQTIAGTGSDIVFNTGLITDSTQYTIVATSVFADCEVSFPQAITVGVEKTKALFRGQFMNTKLNETLTLFNNSKQASSYQWTFGNGSSIASDTSIEPLLSYSTTGVKFANLIATSSCGCTDTADIRTSFIYDPKTVVDNCWAINFDGNKLGVTYEHNLAEKVLVASNGDVIVSGSYSDCLFKTKAGMTGGRHGKSGFFIARYTSNGVLRWVIIGADQNNNNNYVLTNYSLGGAAFDMVLDDKDNLFVAGWLDKDYILYDNHGNEIALNKYNEGFILKLTNDGVFQWYTGIDQGMVTSIDIDDLGNLYTLGTFHNVATFYSLSGSSITKNPGYTLYYIMKLDSVGEIQWITDFSTTQPNYYFEVSDLAASPDGNVYLTGQHANNLTFNSAIGSNLQLNRTGSGASAFLAKYNTLGTPLWAHSINSSVMVGAPFDCGNALAVNANNDIFMTLSVDVHDSTGTINLPSKHKPTQQLSVGGYALISYTGQGDYRWGTGLRYGNSSGGLDVAMDHLGYIYTTGNVGATIPRPGDFTSSDSSKITLPMRNGSFFISKYDNFGKIVWASLESGLSSTNLANNHTPKSIAVDKDQNLFLIGDLRTSTTPYSVATDLLTTNNKDVFLAKFSSSACLQPDSIVALPESPWCMGDSIEVAFWVSEAISMGSGNNYLLELSDSSGSFVSPQTLGTLISSNNSDTITIWVPHGISEGTYLIRVVSTMPSIVGNESPVFIHTLASPTTENITTCVGEPLQLRARKGLSYSWSSFTGIGSSNVRDLYLVADSSLSIWVDISSECGTVTDTFNLIVNPTFQTPLADIYICQSDSVSIFGQTRTTNDVYYDSLVTIHGCDSVISQQLKFYPTYSDTLQASVICSGDSINIFGSFRNVPGYYFDSLQTAYGCDSVRIKRLHVKQPTLVSFPTLYFCPGDSALIFGKYQSVPGIYIDSLQSVNGCDSSISQELILAIPDSTHLSDIEICASDSALIWGSYKVLPGVYSNTFNNRFGCDSLVTVNLVTYSVDTSLTIAGGKFSSNVPNAAYQWLDCSNGFSPIPGATGMSFSPTTNGSYALEVSINGCTDTSSCQYITNVHIAEFGFGQQFMFYPNPTQDVININLGSSYSYISVKVLNAMGQSIDEYQYADKDKLIIPLIGAPGAYILKINTTTGQRAYIKVSKI